jgi:hypothetical protein
MTMELTPQGDDGFSVPENSSGQFIRGQMAKYNDGSYVVDKTEILPDEPLVAVGVTTVWVKWEDGKPVEHRITAAGQIHPDRDDLPDQDDRMWPPGLDGKPADPWKDTRYLYLVRRMGRAMRAGIRGMTRSRASSPRRARNMPQPMTRQGPPNRPGRCCGLTRRGALQQSRAGAGSMPATTSGNKW